RRGLARLGLEPLDQVGGVAPGVGLDLLQEQVARFFGGEAGDALQLAMAVGEHLLGTRCRRVGAEPEIAQRRVAGAQLALELLGVGDAVGERPGAVGEPLLEADDLLLPIAGLPIGVGEERVRLLARLELGFLLEGFGVALRLLAHLPDVLIGAADGVGRDALAAGPPPDDRGNRGNIRDRRDNQDKVHGYGAHRTFYLPTATIAGLSWEKKAPLCRVGRSFEPGQTRWNRRTHRTSGFLLQRHAHGAAPRFALMEHWLKPSLRNHHEQSRELENSWRDLSVNRLPGQEVPRRAPGRGAVPARAPVR